MDVQQFLQDVYFCPQVCARLFFQLCTTFFLFFFFCVQNSSTSKIYPTGSQITKRKFMISIPFYIIINRNTSRPYFVFFIVGKHFINCIFKEFFVSASIFLHIVCKLLINLKHVENNITE